MQACSDSALESGEIVVLRTAAVGPLITLLEEMEGMKTLEQRVAAQGRWHPPEERNTCLALFVLFTTAHGGTVQGLFKLTHGMQER